MNRATFAKLFAYIGASALALGQAGVFGKFSGLLSAVGAVIGGFGIHAAAGTDGSK